MTKKDFSVGENCEKNGDRKQFRMAGLKSQYQF